MRFGIVPPVVHRNPRFDPPAWEETAGIEDLADVTLAAERNGFGFVCVPGHVAVPSALANERGPAYWDQVATLSFLAARTQRIELCAYVVVLGYWHPLQICKTFGTIDRISNERLILGAGVGSLRQEFELLGAPFEDRGARADDALRAVRASWGRREVEYHGTHFDYDGFVVEPTSPRAHVPIWVGGRSKRSLARALEFGDGWAPFRMQLDEIEPWLRDVELPDGFDLVFPPDPPLDPIGDPDRVAETLRAYADARTTALPLRFVHQSKQHYIEQLDAFRRCAAAVR